MKMCRGCFARPVDDERELCDTCWDRKMDEADEKNRALRDRLDELLPDPKEDLE